MKPCITACKCLPDILYKLHSKYCRPEVDGQNRGNLKYLSDFSGDIAQRYKAYVGVNWALLMSNPQWLPS
jgi:hypothetical protein